MRKPGKKEVEKMRRWGKKQEWGTGRCGRFTKKNEHRILQRRTVSIERPTSNLELGKDEEPAEGGNGNAASGLSEL